MKTYRKIITSSILMFFVLSAQATLVFQIERISDTSGIIIASGTNSVEAPSGNKHIFSIDNPFFVAPTGFLQANASATDLSIDGLNINFNNNNYDLYTAPGSVGINGNSNPDLYFALNGIPHLDSSFSGSVAFSLTGGATLAPIGAEGRVFWGFFPGIDEGTWAMVAPSQNDSGVVPEPKSIALASLGLLALMHSRKIKKPSRNILTT